MVVRSRISVRIAKAAILLRYHHGCGSDTCVGAGGRRCVKCGQHHWSYEIEAHERTCEQRPEDICYTCNLHRSQHDNDADGSLWCRGGSGGDHQFNMPFPSAPWANIGLLPQ
jgi:hypothetical protein